MATARLGGGVVALAGSIAGNTFSRSRAGPSVRSKTQPTRRTASRQRQRHHRMSRMRAHWLALSDAQRNSWDLHAKFLPGGRLVRRYGVLTGWNAFVTCNAYVVDTPSSGIMADAPLAIGSAPITNGVAVWAASPLTFVIYSPLTPYGWRDSDLGLSICDISAPKNPDVWRPANHWRNLVVMQGSSVSPPPPYVYFDNPWIAATRQQNQFFRCRQRDEYGRIGPWRYGYLTAPYG